MIWVTHDVQELTHAAGGDDRQSRPGGPRRQRRRGGVRCCGREPVSPESRVADRLRGVTPAAPAGIHTVKVAPRPSPSLCAATRPAVQFHQRAHDRQPQARGRRTDGTCCRRPAGTDRTRTAGTRPGCRCRCRGRQSRRPPSHTGASTSTAPAGVNFTALATRLKTICCSRSGIDQHQRHLRRDVHAEPHALGIRRRAERLGGVAITSPAATAPRREPERPRRGLRDVDEIVGDLRLQARRPFDGLQGEVLAVGRQLSVQQLGPPEQRVERRAQLVRERGDELVLQLVGPLGFAVELGVLHGDGGPSRHFLGQRPVAIVEASDGRRGAPTRRARSAASRDRSGTIAHELTPTESTNSI